MRPPRTLLRMCPLAPIVSLSAPLRAFLASHPSFLPSFLLLIYWYAIVKALPLTDETVALSLASSSFPSDPPFIAAPKCEELHSY